MPTAPITAPTSSSSLTVTHKNKIRRIFYCMSVTRPTREVNFLPVSFVCAKFCVCVPCQLRREGMRLFLIWYEILMDNATDDCHKMFKSLVPKIASSENSEADLFTVKTFGDCKCQSVYFSNSVYRLPSEL